MTAGSMSVWIQINRKDITTQRPTLQPIYNKQVNSRPLLKGLLKGKPSATPANNNQPTTQVQVNVW